MRRATILSLAVAPLLAPSVVNAVVVIQTVTVGNPNNAGELSGEGAGGYGPDRICGAVDYIYNIGKFEVTAAQYTVFLNAVAATDTYGLYNVNMWDTDYGCKIERSGSPGSYTYSVAGDWAIRPVNYVSWGDAARFCNWLHNGQPTGAQDLTTTEDGSYFLDGVTGGPALLTVAREPDATWVIPSEDEWYKAAYHKNDGVTGHYFDYPTSSDSLPSNDLIDPDPGNNATFYIPPDDWTIGSPYYRSEVGAHENSESPYGTYDQGGNVWEWNEAVLFEAYRGLRAGSFDVSGGDHHDLHAADRNFGNPSDEEANWGFRIAEHISAPPALPSAPHDTPKNRILSIDPTTNDAPVAYQVELIESAYFGASVGAKWWLSEPVCTDTNGGAVTPPCTGENVWRSQLVPTAPAPRVWTEDVVHIADRKVVPAATYAVRATLRPAFPTLIFSDELVIATIAKPGTKYWADCVGVWDGAQWTGPNQMVNMDDVMAAVFYFTSAANKPHRTWVEVDDEGVNMVLNFTDIMRIVQGFKAEPYPFIDPGMFLIPGGEFEMGDHYDEGESHELPVHAVYVDSFYLGFREVTNQQYADSLNWALGEGLIDNPDLHNGVVYSVALSAAYCDTTASSSYTRITWDGATFGATVGREDHPVVLVSWYGAAAYANWRSAQEGRDLSYDLSTWECDFDANGYRLPTEAEWEYACRGGQHDPYYRYPWGDTVDGSMANYWGSGDPYESAARALTTPVGYYDGAQTPPGVNMANGYGLYDMAGNVREWCNDWYKGDYYASSPYDNPPGPPGPPSAACRVLRDGSWGGDTVYLRCAHRNRYYPLTRYDNLGFRLALDFQ